MWTLVSLIACMSSLFMPSFQMNQTPLTDFMYSLPTLQCGELT